MEDHFIELINVTKIYHQGDNPVVALDHINLNISKGEFSPSQAKVVAESLP